MPDVVEASTSVSQAVRIVLPTGFPTTVYQLQFTPNLSTPAWSDVGELFNGVDGVTRLFDATSGLNQGFYRVVVP